MTDNQHEQAWRPEVIKQEVELTLRGLHSRSWLEHFYLAGGTGLALQFGHRRSVDLDFFSETTFDEEALIQRLTSAPGFSVVSKEDTQGCRSAAESTLHTGIGGVKVSFLGYPYPVLFAFRFFLGVRVADPRDIGCMKISVIASRGTRRGFIDLYFPARELGLTNLIDLFKTKYLRANYSGVHILKSLTYFDEAERDPMPDMLIQIFLG
ncbi:MAG: nucleotidyl transferase AbiEii/AbiGii toxin family protein [Acidobacteriota bacterium]